MAEDKQPTVPTLLLYGVCGDDFWSDGYTAKGVADWLNENAGAEQIEVRINSGGGFVDDGTAIYNLLAGFPARKRVVIDGVAASMAAIIAMAGDERVMGVGTLLMIHMPWQVTMGDASDHRRNADVLDKFAQQHARILAARSGQEFDAVWRMMEAETWLEAKEAVELGFATEAAEDEAQAAATSRAMAGVRLDFLKLQGALPGPLAAARAQHPSLVPQAQALKRPASATARQLNRDLDEDPKGRAAPSAAAEVRQERSMAKDTSAAEPAEQKTTTVPPVEQKVEQPPVDITAVRAEATRAERARVAEITRMVASVKLPQAFGQKLIDDGTPIEQARAATIDALAQRQIDEQGPEPKVKLHVQPGADASEKWLAGAGQWLMIKAGLSSMISKATGQKLEAGEFRGFRMLDLARDSLERGGVNTRGMDLREMVGRAFTMRGQMPGQTTSDFSVLLETSLHKVLQAAYATAPDTWSRFCATGTVSDFRAHNRYRRGSFGSLDVVNEAGEFRRKAIPDGEKGTITAATKGNIIALTRQAAINDDMGAFSDLAVSFGRAARLSIEVDVYALLALNSGAGPTLLDGNALFHSSHSNIAGTSAAPTVTSVDAARQQMASQKDISGNEFLSLTPAIWLGPLSLGGTVRVINGSQYDPDAANKLQRLNMAAGTFRDIVDTPRLSGTRWYVFADPQVAPVIEVVFLDGVMEPYVETTDGWDIDGTEMKVRLDYGVGAIDFRGALTNPG